MGGPLAELADLIQAGGGFVNGIAVMVNASRFDRLEPDRFVIAEREKTPCPRNS